MFPSRGTTVWVIFRDKPYLGKVVETSPELDMVSVRISNYLDHVSCHGEDSANFSHSCPEPQPPILTGCQSSVVITCGLIDVFPLDSPISHDLRRMCLDNDTDEINSQSENDLKSLDIQFNTEDCKLVPSESNICLSRDINNVEEDEYEDFSNSFEIDSILHDTRQRKRRNSSEYKMWKCGYCNLIVGDENNINHHVLTDHELDRHIESDNWIVIGGVNGLDYEKVKYEEDHNIKSLNNIHLSNNSNRKRQFNEIKSPLDINSHGMNEFEDSFFSNSLETSIRSDIENSFHRQRSEDINLPILNQIIQKTQPLASELSRLSSASLHHSCSIRPNEFSSMRKECNNDLKINNEIFHNFLLNNNFQPSMPFSLINSLPNYTWSERFRSNSLSVNYSTEPTVFAGNSEDHQPMFSAPKRTRLESNIKKCRKMYGIDQRHLWCNQCKWKKACSRFCNDINTSI